MFYLVLLVITGVVVFVADIALYGVFTKEIWVWALALLTGLGLWTTKYRC